MPSGKLDLAGDSGAGVGAVGHPDRCQRPRRHRGQGRAGTTFRPSGCQAGGDIGGRVRPPPTRSTTRMPTQRRCDGADRRAHRAAWHGVLGAAESGAVEAERTIAWLMGYRRQRVRYERDDARYYALVLLARPLTPFASP
jgi:hypothetical protein